jgi:pimeloyl-ACP methyl ester carboxylesterase
MQQKTITTDILDIAYREYGAPDGWPCIMGHGFPYDVNAYAETAPIMAQAGARVLVPWLRGYGSTRFRSAATLRSGEQAALGADLLAFMDALGISRAIFVGFSWGARIACAFGAAFPERAAGLVLIDGGYLEWADIPGIDSGADLSSCVARARRRAESDFFESWDFYFAVQREELGRWSPELAEAHRAMMREVDGKIHPILRPEIGGAIRHGEFQEPLPATYPLIAAAGMPVLLVTAPEEAEYQPAADAAIARFRSALPRARVQSRPDAIHDLVSSAPADLAELIGVFATQPPP